MIQKNVIYYGTDAALAEQSHLRAGGLSLIYEAGQLRFIKLADREIVHGVYVAVRDRHWGTLPPVMTNVQMEIKERCFRISYDARARQGDIDFAWRATITGGEDSTITFAIDGEAHSTFWRNRIGFCVLHPMHECAGAACRIEHVDGMVEEEAFPLSIAPQRMVDGRTRPHQPFVEMRAMSYPVQPGIRADIRFEGDIFEMEDQRNWTDASFKTYCTPLRLPIPLKIEKGTKIRQGITISLHGESQHMDWPVPARAAEVVVSLTNHPPVALPEIGLGTAACAEPLSVDEIERLKCMNLKHLRVDLPLGEPTYPRILRTADGDAKALGVGLEIALFLADDAEGSLARLREELAHIRPMVTRWLIFHGAEGSISRRQAELARHFLEDYEPNAKFCAGTHLNFTELNRSCPPVDRLAVCYSINPQVHAFDNASLVETLEAQGVTVNNARRLASELPVVVTPVTFKPRRGPNIGKAEGETDPGELPPSVDPRQMSLFGAGWTLGSLKHLAEAGAASVTYYETTGWHGVMEDEKGSALPEKFPSLPGCVFPMYHVLADVGAFAGGVVIPARSSDPLHVQALVMSKPGAVRLLLANLSGQPQHVHLPSLGGEARLWLLDETNAEIAMRTPTDFRERLGEPLDTALKTLTIMLRPYAIARVDCETLTIFKEMNR